MTPPAAGAFSATWITRIGGLVFALILAGAFLVQSCFSTVPTDPESLIEPEGIAGARAGAQLGARVQDLEQRAALDAAAAERELASSGAALGGAQLTPAFNETTGDALPGPPVPQTEGEAELREILRLEAIERRTRSLRSAPVAITYRRPETGGLSTAAVTAAAEPTADALAQADAPVDESRASTPLPTEPVSLMQTIQALQALDAQQTAGAELDAGRALPSGRQIQPPAVSPLGSPDSARVVQGDPVNPAIVRAPNTPPGWERIYEGSFIEAVLVNQLNGDFPGPVLASVAVPFYSADRQRIVIPRGARVIGSASAVAGQDQARLAVGFHRLIFPDGRWVSLEFRGLNQIGEGALKDQVNRHYLSMFASVGAVGIMSGLTLRGSNPYAGGMEGVRAGAGQGLAQGATTILDRFLNRLPTITIRAGHRLRIWLTSDVLVPRPGETGPASDAGRYLPFGRSGPGVSPDGPQRREGRRSR